MTRRRPRALSRARRVARARQFEAPTRAESRFVAGLRAIVTQAWRDEVMRLEPFVRLDAGPDVHARVGLLYQEMALEVRLENREAAIRSLGLMPGADLEIERQILIGREAAIRLVESTVGEISDRVRAVLSNPENLGLPVADLAEKLSAIAPLARNRVELIARDQTLKLNAAVNKARMQAAGVEAYTWTTMHDDRVRPTHRKLDGHTFLWSAPPEEGNPGEPVNCRCIAVPVLPEFEGI